MLVGSLQVDAVSADGAEGVALDPAPHRVLQVDGSAAKSGRVEGLRVLMVGKRRAGVREGEAADVDVVYGVRGGAAQLEDAVGDGRDHRAVLDGAAGRPEVDGAGLGIQAPLPGAAQLFQHVLDDEPVPHRELVLAVVGEPGSA